MGSRLPRELQATNDGSVATPDGAWRGGCLPAQPPAQPPRKGAPDHNPAKAPVTPDPLASLAALRATGPIRFERHTARNLQ